MGWNNISFIAASNPFLSLSIFLCCFWLRRQKVLQMPWKSKVRGNSDSWKHTRISSNPTQRIDKKTELSKKVSDSFSKSRKCSAIFRSLVNKYSKITPEEPYEAFCYPHHPVLLDILILWGQWERTPGWGASCRVPQSGRYIPYSLWSTVHNEEPFLEEGIENLPFVKNCCATLQDNVSHGRREVTCQQEL